MGKYEGCSYTREGEGEVMYYARAMNACPISQGVILYALLNTPGPK